VTEDGEATPAEENATGSRDAAESAVLLKAAEVIAAAERGDPPMRLASERRRIRVVWNANAGRKAGLPTNKVSEDELRRVMRKYRLGNELVPTHSEEEAIAVVQDAREQGYDTVVAAGGDGTVGLVARHLLGSDTALGIFPLGSVMNVARQLGIPRNLEAAAAIVALGYTRHVDIGTAHGEPFFESAAVGMNAAIFSQLSRIEEGDWRAFPRAIRMAFAYRPTRMHIRLDRGSLRIRALLTTVSIGPYNAAGFTVAPDAKLDDGLFDVTVFRHFSKLELFRHLVSIAFGRRAYSPHVKIYRSARARIDGTRPLPVRADGHDLGETPMEFVVKPKALKAITPGAVETFSG
jgi:diacylglycerol kinase (ATP)